MCQHSRFRTLLSVPTSDWRRFIFPAATHCCSWSGLNTLCAYIPQIQSDLQFCEYWYGEDCCAGAPAVSCRHVAFHQLHPFTCQHSAVFSHHAVRRYKMEVGHCFCAPVWPAFGLICSDQTCGVVHKLRAYQCHFCADEFASDQLCCTPRVAAPASSTFYCECDTSSSAQASLEVGSVGIWCKRVHLRAAW